MLKKCGGSRSGGQPPLVTPRAGVAFLYPPLAVYTCIVSPFSKFTRLCELLQMHLMRWQHCVMKACANKHWRKLGVQLSSRAKENLQSCFLWDSTQRLKSASSEANQHQTQLVTRTRYRKDTCVTFCTHQLCALNLATHGVHQTNKT